jgi:hypothetical protein
MNAISSTPIYPKTDVSLLDLELLLNIPKPEEPEFVDDDPDTFLASLDNNFGK